MAIQKGASREASDGETLLASETETAEYIGDLLRQLEKMAQSAGLVRLAYLLRESVEEAEKAAG